MKIHRYDQEQNILVVSFSTDKSLKSVDEYQVYAFNVKELNVNSINDLLKKIASMGVDIAMRNDKMEKMPVQTFTFNDLNSLTGKVYTFSSTDIPGVITDDPDSTNIIVS